MFSLCGKKSDTIEFEQIFESDNYNTVTNTNNSCKYFNCNKTKQSINKTFNKIFNKKSNDDIDNSRLKKCNYYVIRTDLNPMPNFKQQNNLIKLLEQNNLIKSLEQNNFDQIDVSIM